MDSNPKTTSVAQITSKQAYALIGKYEVYNSEQKFTKLINRT